MESAIRGDGCEHAEGKDQRTAQPDRRGAMSRPDWKPYATNAHRADLPDGWYLFVHKIGDVWRWAANAPLDPNQDLEDRYRQAEDEGRVGALEPGRTVRDAKRAAETADRGPLSSPIAIGDSHG